MTPSMPPLASPVNPEATETLAEPGGSLIIQTRLIKAPRERVWAAWTEPAQLGQWWGPRDFSVTTDVFEFRVGGHWVFTMHGPDPDPRSKNPGGPRDFPNHIVWTRIERSAGSPESGSAPLPWYLEFDHVRADRIDTPLFKAAVTFEGRGDHTLLTWRADFGSNAVRDQIIRDYGAARGGRETTARLATHTEGKGFDQTDEAQGHRLVLSRIVPVRRELVWRAWTESELLMQWFCPRPYGVDRCVMDLRAGGRFYTHMFGPDDWQSDNDGSYLEVIPGERLSFTDLLLADWTPCPNPGLRFTATLIFEDAEPGHTRYTAIARHASAEGREQHARMGFHDGWGTATDQLVELVRRL
jgi:uncharacterized protein YndB with AHSA1/START domain